jgi:hypothetical protein
MPLDFERCFWNRFDDSKKMLPSRSLDCNPISRAIAFKHIVARIDDYVLDVLMRDLVGHDRSPSAYLVYLHLWGRTIGRRAKTARLSHQMVASGTGLSKSAAQAGMRRLVRRRLVSVHRESATATPEYQVLRPWVKANVAKINSARVNSAKVNRPKANHT